MRARIVTKYDVELVTYTLGINEELPSEGNTMVIGNDSYKVVEVSVSPDKDLATVQVWKEVVSGQNY